MTDFRSAPPALSDRERWVVAGASVIVAVSRLAALARGPWDWDEMLFLLALRDYDVSLHHPHPPGFPLFILAAKGLVVAGVSPFHALQIVNLAAAMFIVPAIFFFCRELRLSFESSLSAAVVFAFLPNVWFFGGTGFSDVVAIVIAVIACALLLRGARSGRALIAGAFILGIAAGFRPQNLLVGLVPALVGCWYQIRGGRKRVVAGAMIAGAIVVVVSYAGAALATGDWAQYRDSVVAHQSYLAGVDSFLSRTRPSLVQVSDDFFTRPFRFPILNVVLTVLAATSIAVSIVRRSRPVLLALAAFGPFWILAWLTLDFHSASRFSIGYMPLYAILCADAIMIIASVIGRDQRRSRGIAGTIVVALTLALAIWTWPAIARARRELSPPIQAVNSIRKRFPVDTQILVQKRMRPFAEYFIGDFDLVHLEEHQPASASNPRALYLREGSSNTKGAMNFTWPRETLWNVARRRYFDVSVVPLR